MFGRKRKEPSEPSGDAARPGFLARLRQKLNRGDSWLTYDLANLLPGGKVDAAVLEEIELRLLSADVGVEATERIMANLHRKVSRNRLGDLEALLGALREEMLAILAPVSVPLEIPADVRPFVILMVGVNGAGKTTTIGKLARRFREAGLSVLLAAGDTFRAAAVEQLEVWGERHGVPVIAQSKGADPAAVVYDAFEAARARGIDVLIADTAGRLHTQRNLMDELIKVKRVLRRIDAAAPHEVMLVLDAGIGQNALAQADQFNEALGLTGLTVTKLDGTAKGGVVFAIASRLGVPIRYIGVGEQAEDLGTFDAVQFVDAVLAGQTASGS